MGTSCHGSRSKSLKNIQNTNLKDIAAVAAIQNKIIANKIFYVIENFSWANEYSLLCYHGN